MSNIIKTHDGHEMIEVDNLSCTTLVNGKVEYRPIKRLIRHKVDKDRHTIHAEGGKSIVITADHCAMVFRDGELLKVAADEINTETDQLFLDDNGSATLVDIKSIEVDTATEKDYMYDIQMEEDPHIFFGNDILVHNSVYVNIKPLTEVLLKGRAIGRDIDGVYDKDIEYEDTQILCVAADDICDKLNVFSDRMMQKKFNAGPGDRCIKFGRETVCSSGLFFAKKRYIIRTLNMDGDKDLTGKYIVDTYFKPVGVEIKKSEHPDAIKHELKHIFYSILEEPWSSEKFAGEIMRIWDKFRELPPEDMAFWRGYNTKKDVLGFLEVEKGAQAGAKGCEFFNHVIEHMGLDNKYEKIKPGGDRTRMIYVHSTNKYNINVISWQGGTEYPEEFKDVFIIDQPKMFDKVFLAALKRLIVICNFPEFNPYVEVLDDIMDI